MTRFEFETQLKRSYPSPVCFMCVCFFFPNLGPRVVLGQFPLSSEHGGDFQLYC
jgi:hypothetical protein